MNHNGLTRSGVYELNSFNAFMKIKKSWLSVTSEFVEHHGNKNFSALLPRSDTHCLGFFELESKMVNKYSYG